MTDDMHTRIAAALGWRVEDVRGFSMPTLRDIARARGLVKLEHEITQRMKSTTYVARTESP